MKPRKICVVTGTRADYGLLRWLMQEIKDEPNLKLQIIATGMHLSPEFGLTYKQIIEDGFQITKKIEILLSSDTSIGISKSMGLAQISFAEAYQELKPDIVVVLGDRYEIFAAAASAMISNIPLAHIHGGEITLGAIDESMRHAITKMSHLHFASTQEYKNRIIQMGENPDNVHNFGAPGLDNLNKINFYSRKEIQKELDIAFLNKNILVTYHPVTVQTDNQDAGLINLLEALEKQEDTFIIFTKSNSDEGGRMLNRMVDNFVEKHPDKAKAFTSLGQQRYLSLLKEVDLVVGNSSSGIIEAPSFKTATLNIGKRQQGRIRAKSVINCKPDKIEIEEGINKALSQDFMEILTTVKNPYYQNNSSKKIKNILKSTNLKNILFKPFHDLQSSK